MFAYRYFEVAEMFGRDDKTLAKHNRVRKVTRIISYVCVALITLNYLVFIAYKIDHRINGTTNDSLVNWTGFYIPNTWLFIDCVLLLVGLVWICHSLRHDPQVMGNEKWMAIYTGLLLLTLGAYIYSTVVNVVGESDWLLSGQIGLVCDTVVCLLMCYIMNQVNYP